MAEKYFSTLWSTYHQETLAGCPIFLELPIEIAQIIAEYLPWSRLLQAVRNPYSPRMCIHQKSSRVECNISYFLVFLKKNPWWIDGSRPDVDLWKMMWTCPFSDQTIMMEYEVSRHRHVERRHTEIWDEFCGSIRLSDGSCKLTYERPTYWSFYILDHFLGKLLGRNEEYQDWGYSADDYDY